MPLHEPYHIELNTAEDVTQYTLEQLTHINQNASQIHGSIGVGRTQYEMFEQVAQDQSDLKRLFQEIAYYQMDEYISGNPDHPQKLRNVISDKLWRYIEKDSSLLNWFNNAVSPHDALEAMTANINAIGALDFIVTGIGDDAHLGFIPEDTDFSKAVISCAVPPKTRIQNAGLWGGEDNVPSQCLTMGPKTFIEARHLFLMVTGQNKNKALNSLLNDDNNYYRQIILHNKNTHIISDAMARGF